MSLSTRLLFVATVGLFLCLNLIQVIVFGPPLGAAAAPDVRITGYSVQDARDFLAAIGPRGQGVFFGIFRWVDTVFPPLLALSIVVLFRLISAGRWSGLIWGFALFPIGYSILGGTALILIGCALQKRRA